MPSSRYRHRRRNPIFDHMSEIFSVPIALNSLFEQQHRQIANAQRSATPRYDISEDDSKMELAFDLPGVRPEDISLEIQDNGTILKVSGSRKYRQHGEVVTTEFDQMFTIDDSVLDVEKISAKMSDGVLLVSAPKLEPKVKTQDRKIAVEENLVDAAEGEMKIVGTKDAKEKEEHTANEVDDTAGVDSEKDLEIGEEEDIE